MFWMQFEEFDFHTFDGRVVFIDEMTLDELNGQT